MIQFEYPTNSRSSFSYEITIIIGYYVIHPSRYSTMWYTRWYVIQHIKRGFAFEVNFDLCIRAFSLVWNCSSSKFIQTFKLYFWRRLKILFWLQGLLWTNSIKSSPLIFYHQQIFLKVYFVKFGGETIRPLVFWALPSTESNNFNRTK